MFIVAYCTIPHNPSPSDPFWCAPLGHMQLAIIFSYKQGRVRVTRRCGTIKRSPLSRSCGGPVVDVVQGPAYACSYFPRPTRTSPQNTERACLKKKNKRARRKRGAARRSDWYFGTERMARSPRSRRRAWSPIPRRWQAPLSSAPGLDLHPNPKLAPLSFLSISCLFTERMGADPS